MGLAYSFLIAACIGLIVLLYRLYMLRAHRAKEQSWDSWVAEQHRRAQLAKEVAEAQEKEAVKLADANGMRVAVREDEILVMPGGSPRDSAE